MEVFKGKAAPAGGAAADTPAKSSYTKDKDGNPEDPCKDLAEDKCKDEDKKASDAYKAWKADVEAATAAKTAFEGENDATEKAKLKTKMEEADKKAEASKKAYLDKIPGGGGNMGLIIFGVIAVFGVGALVYYYKCRGDSEEAGKGGGGEGGDKEAKTLYKAQIKGKKVNNKENLV